MRAKYPTNLQAPAATAARGSGRPDRSRLPRPRSVAAGGALLVQLWGAVLGATCAQAAAPGTPPGSVPTAAVSGPAAAVNPVRVPRPAHRQAPGDAPSPAADRPGPTDESPSEPPTRLLGGLTGSVLALGSAAAPVDHLLQERIRAGGLPLPGQGKTVPDAFAIAAVLFPATPSEPHDAGPRASRDAESGAQHDSEHDARHDARHDREWNAPDRTLADADAGSGPSGNDGWTAVPVAAPAGTATEAVAHGAAAGPRAWAPEPGARASLVPAQRQHRDDHGPDTVTAAPVGTQTAGTGAAVLVPITAGLLLTGAAMYKHRGLPKGH